MPRLLLAASLALVAAATPAVSLAQSPNPLVGSWTIEYERGRRVENGVTTPINSTGTLTIEPVGDSLRATLTPAARADGTPSPVSTMVGPPTASGVTFVQKQTVNITLNGESSAREITLTWKLHATGDVLSGTLERELPMLPEPAPPSPVKGTRVKS